jgi:hypothetical protein
MENRAKIAERFLRVTLSKWRPGSSDPAVIDVLIRLVPANALQFIAISQHYCPSERDSKFRAVPINESHPSRTRRDALRPKTRLLKNGGLEWTICAPNVTNFGQ